MLRRCNDPKDRDYHRYGGRGIKVCERWLSFDNYLADTGVRPSGMTLDRINNDADYGPDNWRWATRKEQVRNTANTLFVEYEGQRVPLAELAERFGLHRSTLRSRLKKMDVNTAVSYKAKHITLGYKGMSLKRSSA